MKKITNQDIMEGVDPLEDKMADESYEVVRDNKNYMFAEFHSKDEYQQAYESVLNNTKRNSQFELVIFIERLRTTMLCSLEPISKTERKTNETND